VVNFSLRELVNFSIDEHNFPVARRLTAEPQHRLLVLGQLGIHTAITPYIPPASIGVPPDTSKKLASKRGDRVVNDRIRPQRVSRRCGDDEGAGRLGRGENGSRKQ
jgi:hypothetical protein